MSRLLWEIGTEGGEIVMLRSRLGMDSGQMSRMLRALESRRARHRDAERRRRAHSCCAPHPARDSPNGPFSTNAATSWPPRSSTRSTPRSAPSSSARCAPSNGSSRHPSSSCVRSIPQSPEAQRCLRAYVAELNRRAPQRGFDPSTGATADPHEVRPPSGAFVLAYLRGEAIGCGAVKHQPDDVTDIKRMWIAESARGSGRRSPAPRASRTPRP